MNKTLEKTMNASLAWRNFEAFKKLANIDANIEWSKTEPTPIPKVPQVKIVKNHIFWKAFIISNLRQLNP